MKWHVLSANRQRDVALHVKQCCKHEMEFADATEQTKLDFLTRGT
jgi:hypothetical protein